jgi:site-specific recombinase XerC
MTGIIQTHPVGSSILNGPVSLPADRNPFYVYLARLSAGSRPTMAEALGTVARIASGGRLPPDTFPPWHCLRYPHVQAVRTALTETISRQTGRPLSPATINKTLSALRGVLKEAWRLGLMSAEDLARATDVEPVRGSRPLKGRALELHEVAALFHACMRDQTAAGPRDAVILALGVGAGLRRAEIAGLDLADVDVDGEIVRVLGKGRKVREVPIKGGTLEAIRAWLACRGPGAGPLVCPVRKGGRVVVQR